MQRQRITPADLDIPLTLKDERTIYEFEHAWTKFMKENPHLLMGSKRVGNIKELETEIQKIEDSKIRVETELQRQLNFFTSSRQRLEEHYKKEMAAAATNQRQVHANIQKQLDNVAIVEREMQEVFPWNRFQHALDSVAGPDEEQNIGINEKTPKQGKTIKPSARAMYLVNSGVGDEQDINLRAYRIDHALLNAQIKILQKEVETTELTTGTLEVIGQFLTENNIWALLTKTPPPTK